ncbi:hypothetical protein L249_2139 [Ophiocordyceps polyrhachis-furcata BCC 54312]|uniref:Uncharacterized protein n=1 Tax=Ophiocordyceps polyrhachis-furcata BCC 54312 TaxID=1330021 RepID=A0A367LP33_9HYPO|nr:hypothetical protein L249_2139 [Ophiocordyceps polyrhachis-furcata BCC 54312]
MAASPQRRSFLPSAVSFASLRKGHSRFSKALPSIPVEEDDERNSSSSSRSSSSNSSRGVATRKAGRPTPPWRSPTYTLSSLLSPRAAPTAATTTTAAATEQSPTAENKTLPPTPSTPPSPRIEIWRRRSQKPSHSSRGGSTATSSSAADEDESLPPSPHAGPDAVTSPPGRPAVSLLKKKKKKRDKEKHSSSSSSSSSPSSPSSSPSPTPTAENQAMGNDSSKLSLVKKSLQRRRSEDVKTKSNKGKNNSNLVRLAAQRPPTPEYGTEDAAAAPADVTTTFVSPVSPAPSESPRTVEALKASSSPSQHVVSRKPLPSANPGVDALVGLDGAGLHSPPSSPHGRGWSFRASDSTESVGFAGPRSVSSRLDLQRQDTERPRRPTMDGDPRLVQSETQGLLFRGRDGTLYPEMKVTREPHESASYFPVQTDKLSELGAVIPAGPLKDSHYGCYQGHRTMNRRQNRNYPLTCQTCDKADTEDRWACIFCNLRICEACMRALNGHHRVLRRLVDELALNTPLSLSSMSRPGSAVGMPPTKVF